LLAADRRLHAESVAAIGVVRFSGGRVSVAAAGVAALVSDRRTGGLDVRSRSRPARYQGAATMTTRPDYFPHYPHIKVQLTGKDGNVFRVLGACVKAMRAADLDQTEIDAFWKEASSSDYDHALQTCIRWLDCR
jgi:hypothetical protein